MNNLNDLFIEQLRDVYSAETQLVDALPKMAKAASNDKLKQAFQNHLDQTKEHVRRLETIFDSLETRPDGKKCKGMEGLIKEGEEMIKEDGEPSVKDAGLIAAAQRVEHYEIAAYGTVCTYAEMLSKKDALDLLKQTIDEEKETDDKLTKLAKSTVNEKALEGH